MLTGCKPTPADAVPCVRLSAAVDDRAMSAEVCPEELPVPSATGVVPSLTSAPTTSRTPVVPPTTSATPTSSTPTATRTTTATTPTEPPGTSLPEVSDYPGPSNTGVPPGSDLTMVVGDFYARTPGQVIDLKHITGSLVVEAEGVVIKRSMIDDSVISDTGSGPRSLTITDSTVGPARCGTPTWTPNGVGFARYTAIRVHVRGHEDGFRASGPDVTIRDSYYKACVASHDAHADGIQDYPAAQRLVVDHNTFDMADLTGGYTAPIFVYSDTTNAARITNNLAMGGVSSLYLKPKNGSWVVSGNRVADKEFAYFPYETDGLCGSNLSWSDNDVVTVDANYNVTSTVEDNVPCPR